MTEFEKYIKSDFGVGDSTLYDYKSSMTPMVIEEREMRGIVDVMDYIKCDIATVNTGMAASMGSILLGAGTKGKRSSLRFSKTMLHQSSGGAVGNIQDARITMDEWEKTNALLFDLLGKYCGKTAKRVMKDSSRDKWLTAQESLDYGIIDEVIGLK